MIVTLCLFVLNQAFLWGEKRVPWEGGWLALKSYRFVIQSSEDLLKHDSYYLRQKRQYSPGEGLMTLPSVELELVLSRAACFKKDIDKYLYLL